MADKGREIQASEWISFLDDFTRQYRGSPVRVEVQEGRGGPQVEAHDIPLQGISADNRGSEHDVNIMVGDELAPGLTHMIPGARRLLAEPGEGDAAATLIVEANDGSRTTVRVWQARRAA